MAKHEVIMMVCDKCGTESKELSEFYHVTVTGCQPLDKKGKKMVHSDRDLCESCVGMPGVNRDA